jgi:hypothetical protein
LQLGKVFLPCDQARVELVNGTRVIRCDRPGWVFVENAPPDEGSHEGEKRPFDCIDPCDLPAGKGTGQLEPSGKQAPSDPDEKGDVQPYQGRPTLSSVAC